MLSLKVFPGVPPNARGPARTAGSLRRGSLNALRGGGMKKNSFLAHVCVFYNLITCVSGIHRCAGRDRLIGRSFRRCRTLAGSMAHGAPWWKVITDEAGRCRLCPVIHVWYPKCVVPLIRYPHPYRYQSDILIHTDIHTYDENRSRLKCL